MDKEQTKLQKEKEQLEDFIANIDDFVATVMAQENSKLLWKVNYYIFQNRIIQGSTPDHKPLWAAISNLLRVRANQLDGNKV